jgi:hypothetical protein
MYYSTKWITIEEAKLLYAKSTMGFHCGVSLHEHKTKPVIIAPKITQGPKFNRGKRKIKKW